MLKMKFDKQQISITTSPFVLLENQSEVKHRKQYLKKFKYIEVRKCFIMLLNDDTWTYIL